MPVRRRSAGELCEALHAYLARHPAAADGLLGIRLWWLPAHLRDVSLEALHEALTELVERGEVRCTTMLDGTELYARGSGNGSGSDSGETQGRPSAIPKPRSNPAQ